MRFPRVPVERAGGDAFSPASWPTLDARQTHRRWRVSVTDFPGALQRPLTELEASRQRRAGVPAQPARPSGAVGLTHECGGAEGSVEYEA